MANHYTREIPRLSTTEAEELHRWVRRRSTAHGLAFRAQIILTCAEGESDLKIAHRLNTTRETVGKWRRRFLRLRCDGLLDDSRPGAPRQINDEDVERIVTMTLESVPRDATYWSTRTMAKASGMTQSAVSRIWRAFGLQPHRTETFKLSKDPLFIEKVRDVVGLYMDPPERAVVFCVDEKSQVQALERTQPLLPMRPGQAERHTHDYERHGTTFLFAALNTATGEVIRKCYRRHRAAEFKKFLQLIDKNVPTNYEVHLILDNYGTHKAAMIHNYLLGKPRFHLHFTPTSSSWLDLVERWFALITQQQIRRGTFRSTTELEEAIHRYLAVHNEDPKPFIWIKTADQILESLKRYCEYINDSIH